MTETPEERCPRFGKWLGCKFEPRYDKSPADLSQFSNIKRMEEPVVEKFRSVTYICDVCVRCGSVSARSPDKTEAPHG